LFHQATFTDIILFWGVSVFALSVSYSLMNVKWSDASILVAGHPSSLSGICFLRLLEEDEMAFDNLFCVTFQMMDAQWLAKRATYMEFNVMYH